MIFYICKIFVHIINIEFIYIKKKGNSYIKFQFSFNVNHIRIVCNLLVILSLTSLHTQIILKYQFKCIQFQLVVIYLNSWPCNAVLEEFDLQSEDEIKNPRRQS